MFKRLARHFRAFSKSTRIGAAVLAAAGTVTIAGLAQAACKIVVYAAEDEKTLAALTKMFTDQTAIDTEVARLTLESSGARIDALTPAQREYLNSWRQGS